MMLENMVIGNNNNMKKPNHYVDNEKFLESIIEWRAARKIAIESNEPTPRIPEFCGKCVLQIANGLSQKHCFRNYTFVDEMVFDAIENCLKYFHNFDSDKYKNPHAYFTTISKYAFLRRIEDEEKSRYVKYKSFDMANIMKGHEAGAVQNNLESTAIYDNIGDFIQRFEAKQEIKKQKRKDKQEENVPVIGLEAYMEIDDE